MMHKVVWYNNKHAIAYHNEGVGNTHSFIIIYTISRAMRYFIATMLLFQDWNLDTSAFHAWNF